MPELMNDNMLVVFTRLIARYAAPEDRAAIVRYATIHHNDNTPENRQACVDFYAALKRLPALTAYTSALTSSQRHFFEDALANRVHQAILSVEVK